MANNVTLYDYANRPIKRQDLTREIAAPVLAGVRTIWTDTVASGLTPATLAGVLQAAAMGDHDSQLTLAEEMEERDLHYACELSKRKLAVGRLPITVEAASDDAKDIEIADAVRALTKRAGVRGLVKDALDALGKGFSVSEIMWDRTGSKWWPAGYEYRDPRWFTWDKVSLRRLLLKDESNIDGIPLAPYKFIVHVPRIKSGIPIRGGLARLAAWAFMCKGYTVKDWLAFAEVFGMPLRMGKYGPSASEADKNVLRMAVANLGSDAAAIFPESMQVELVEAAKSSSQDFFKILADYLDTQISKGILGQTASASGTPGKLGDEKLQSEVRDDIRDDDAEQLEETIQRDLVQPFVDLNFGPQEAYPQIQLRAPESEDLAAHADALAKLVPLSLRVEQSVVRDRFGWPDPDKNAKPEDLLGAPPAAPAAGLNRALNRAQTLPVATDGVGRLAGHLADRADGPVTEWVEHLRQLSTEANSLEELRDMVAGAFPGMPVDRLAAIMGEEMMRAEMIGRSEVADGA